VPVPSAGSDALVRSSISCTFDYDNAHSQLNLTINEVFIPYIAASSAIDCHSAYLLTATETPLKCDGNYRDVPFSIKRQTGDINMFDIKPCNLILLDVWLYRKSQEMSSLSRTGQSGIYENRIRMSEPQQEENKFESGIHDCKK
jgi:hypothetical protein